MSSRRNPTSILSSTGGDLSRICNSCATTLRRRYASTATALADLNPTTEEPSPSINPAYLIKTSVILSRPPQITRDLHPFEKAFFLYQRRLNERLALPFTRYFYYTKGTPKFVEFQKKLKARKTLARDIGLYEAYGKDKWNDEAVVGALESEPTNQVEALLEDEKPFKDENEPVKTTEAQEQAIYTRPAPRETEADRTGDEKSLNRLLQRTLYLMVQDKSGQWRFPTTLLKNKERESLRVAAERALVQSAGPNMNTWLLGNHPVGHLDQKFKEEDQKKPDENGKTHIGDVTFFMKGHIMAGQADVKSSEAGVSDFKWLAKEEIEKLVPANYFASVANVLPER